jgi:hypothetical protein
LETQIRSHCPECGGLISQDDSCTLRYQRFLVLEFSDARFGAVHHLTVPAYMLQHPGQLSSAGWHAMRQTLSAFLIEGVPPAQMRRHITQSAQTQPQKESLTRGSPFQFPPGFAFTRTILSVDDSAPEAYCRDIEAWARQVLAEVQPLAVSNKP